MSSEPVVRVADVSKCYRLYDDPRQRLWEFLALPGRRRRHREFWALSHVSFDVAPGEAVAVIGRNGSGKSTLLQCIAGTLTPTSGAVSVSGRVGALLELGTGFSPEFTGRENVYLAAGVLGFSRRETEARFDAIAEFAEIGEFMDQPVKAYSSGMVVRLAFAVQTAVAPDVLIVDEALAVGDIFFQQKCLARMRELREAGTTLLLVSHDMGLVRDLTQRAVYLRSGRAEAVGPTHEVIHRYLKEGRSGETLPDGGASAAVAARASDEQLDFMSTALWVLPDRGERGAGVILAVTVVDTDGNSSLSVPIGGSLTVRVLMRSYTERPLHAAVEIKNKFSHVISSRGSYTENVIPPSLELGATAIFESRIRFELEAGEYTFCVKVGLETREPNSGELVDCTDWLGPLRVCWDYDLQRAPFLGMFGLPVACRFASSRD